jgi:hypothetical protein
MTEHVETRNMVRKPELPSRLSRRGVGPKWRDLRFPFFLTNSERNHCEGFGSQDVASQKEMELLKPVS